MSHLWGDVDGDGLKDLFVLNLKGNVLFRNLGHGDFEDVTAMAFPDGAGKGISGFFGDYNGDEMEDLFLFHQDGFDLFRNEGKFRFTKVTEELGLDPGLSKGCARLEDFDGDGFNDLLVKTEKGDRIFRSREGKEYVEVLLSSPDSGRGGMAGCGKTMGPVPPVKNPGGPLSPGAASSGGFTANTLFVNDNSPGSVGVGVPEVEGGDDGSTQNDIVDETVTGADILDESLSGAEIMNDSLTGAKIENGTLTGADIQNGSLTGSDIENGSVDPAKVAGTAATLTGSQNFDNGTFHIDATNNHVNIGTTGFSAATMHVDSDEIYGCWVETSSSQAWAIWGRATAAAGYATGVYGESESTSGRGLYGRARATTGTTYGVRGESESTSGYGVYGLAGATTGENYGVKGHSSSTSGRGVYGDSPYIGVRGYGDSTSGYAYGVYGECDSTSGRGVYGKASAASGTTYGVRGESASTSGRGIYGSATSSSGTTYGVRGYSASTSGRGVYGSSSYIGVEGYSSSTSAHAYGVYGESNSTLGRGLYGRSPYKGVEGYAENTSGNSYGVYGESNSIDGCGVYGTSYNIGVQGHSSGDYGWGVYGDVTGAGGTTYGVYGISDSTYGRAVYGQNTASTGNSYGVYGETSSSNGRGVYGSATATSGTNYGVRGASASTSGRGVYGNASASSGTNYGMRGYTSSSSGYGMYSVGDLGCSGTKYFVQPHPRDPSKEIRFVCLEGNESGTYFRGSSELEGGEAIIEVPEEFRLVTEEEGLTVQVTPLGAARIWVEEKTLDRIKVRGDMDVEFDYFVNGVRKGFTHIDLVRENHEWVPEYRDRPFGTQFPEALRRILVENGTLNPDFTPNAKTAARMGWELRDFEEDEPRLVDSKKIERPTRRVPERDRNRLEDRIKEPPLKRYVDVDRIEKSEDPDHPTRDSEKTLRMDEAPPMRETTRGIQ